MQRKRAGISKKAWSLAAAFAALAFIAPVWAAPQLSGQDSYHNVVNLTQQIQWYTGLPQAEEEAKREHKLVFWMHMLGNLSGAT